ncbi:U32 family peptidase [Ruficoccus amylovorans]|uniref:U32 family peptidase n=1 Tax=Ruficoccus amylovorans TaxID=1804625 RepID=A0A842HDP7_9BACT|nr:U32 family peptidase [Ruficoccus amylovorans]MBC2594168.1 U32 family peptidase [Ruficoccus amylovorans]
MGKLLPKRLGTAGTGDAQLLRKPELLAPAGDWECARAAIENGADAIYFGLECFNARLRAHNFATTELPEIMARLHERGVRGYVTFNTLVFADELAQAEDFLRKIIAAGTDAAIVQDVGICRLIRRLSPDFPIHASTQMSITSEAGVRFAAELGCSVAVLARECSLQEVAAIREKCEADWVSLPLEIFVHGALCVAYSGQCLTSEALGGRSANRGECAQACRLPYELISDGKNVPLGDRRYLLSPQDLAGLDALPGIVRAGVSSLKIEGRLKSPEYVAAVTGVYRRALDKAWAELGPQAEALASSTAVSGKPAASGETPSAQEERYQLDMTFSRGFHTGWLEGIDNQQLVHARFGKKRGVRLGTVKSTTPHGLLIVPEGPVKPGDGVVVDQGRPDLPEAGGNVNAVEPQGKLLFLRLHGDALQRVRIEPGSIVWKTADPALERTLRQSFEVEQPRYKRPLEARTEGADGQPLRLTVWDEEGLEAVAESAQPLETAQRQPLAEAILRKQLGRLGDTPFFLAALDNRLPGGLMLPLSLLNACRREAVERLLEKRRTGQRWTLLSPSDNEADDETKMTAGPEAIPPPSAKANPALIPLVRSLEQLDAALEHPAGDIYVELENPRRYPEAVERVRAAGAGHTVWVAPPRIFKTGEDWIIKQLLGCGADGFLARNHEHLRALAGQRLRGDFSLNVANPLTARWLIERWGLERLTCSYDLNASQLAALLESAPPAWFEVTLHQHMPMFHMEHCVFCAFLSSGKDFRDCGRPCETQSVSLRDRVGAEHPLKADAGCRNTLFNARAQTGAEFAQDLLGLGVRHFRIEFLNESPQEVRETLHRYAALLRGEINGTQLWHELRLVNQLGVTRGTLRD